MTRFCGNCGTEVDETAAFCPTCGQPLDEAAEVEMPPAPAWPERPVSPQPPSEAATPPEPAAPSSEWSRPAPPPSQEAPEPGPQPDRSSAAGEPTQPTAAPYGAPPPPGSTAPPPPAPAGGQQPAPSTIDLPITWPVTLSAWLIGGGALVGALGALIGLFSPSINAWDVILLLLLGAIAVSVFFSASIPAIPHLRLGTLVIVLIATGIALDRIGFGFAGIGTVLLLFGAAAAAIGAVILELGRDQPLGGPRA